MINTIIDINADVGEGIGNEKELMPYISSCNIACGGHTGDFDTMRKVVELAIKHHLKIGAHPSFPDTKNFGRQVMEMSCVALYTSIREQIQKLVDVLNDLHKPLHHVKPHGALYNLAAVDEKTANVIIEVMKTSMSQTKLYVPYDSVISHLALKNNIPIVYEVFADRNYNDDLTLVSRSESNAIINDADVMFEHLSTMFFKGKVKTVSNNYKTIKAETFCIHGDNPKSVTLLKTLLNRLKLEGISVR